LEKVEFIKPAAIRLYRFKLLLIIFGIIIGVLFFIQKFQKGIVYTSRSTIFPLTAVNEGNSITSSITSLLGINSDTKSFSQDASINIVELAQSRFTREAVALQQLPQFDNKSIGELLISRHNKTKFFFFPAIEIPKDTSQMAAVAADLMEDDIVARINKNGILELFFSSNDSALVHLINYSLTEKISKFYIELRIKKAKLDYDFISLKVDSLQQVLGNFDKHAIQMANTTFFVAPDRLQYQLPKENLGTEKDRVQRQFNAAIDNKEEALWRLQKVTPIVELLDKPEPPFDLKRPYAFIFAFVGFFIGIVLISIPLVVDIAFRYVKWEIKNAIFNPNVKATKD